MKKRKRSNEAGVITVEACTSLMIFIFAFYILIEIMKVFAVQACMQDVLSSMATDIAMEKYYSCGYSSGVWGDDRTSSYYKSLSNLTANDYNDDRLQTIHDTVPMGSSRYCVYYTLADYYMTENNNMARLFAEDNVYWKNIDVSDEWDGSGTKIKVKGTYAYRVVDVPFFGGRPFWIFYTQEAVTYSWK